MPEAQTKAVITVKKDNRDYSFTCLNDASLGEAYDVLQEIASFIVSKMNEHQMNQKPKDNAQEVI